MANKLKKPDLTREHTFPPEADGDFCIVNPKDIIDWRGKLNARFGIGQGKLVVVDDPITAA